MYTQQQISRVLEKLERLERMTGERQFRKVDEMSIRSFLTDGSHHAIPGDENFGPCPKGTTYEGAGIYVWMKGTYQVPEALAGQTLYIWPKVQAYEGLLWVDGQPYGNFASRIAAGSHGNHYCDLIRKQAKAGETVDIAIEFYAHHYVKGTQPLREEAQTDFIIRFDSMDLCVRQEELSGFHLDLKLALQLTKALAPNSFRRAEIVRGLLDIHEFIYYDMDNVSEAEFMEGIRRAEQILKPLLARKNAGSAPYAGLIGHSHMDTAWLWTQRETAKKCARTYSNQISLMDQYPDYTFVQSSAYHSDMMRRLYPALFERIREKVAQGRYEPNGGVWIECDCNIPSGEYLIRQFLWGQRFTRKYFGYRSDSFWLPDTFGYCASLPQIMQGCGIRYFLTTKIAWNDTNEFPYSTFYWKGIDGSRVLTHFNRTHVWPDPMALEENVMRAEGCTIKEKEVSDMRLISYGFGDGGGGPEFEMVECAERLADVEGLPRTEHTTVSAFMHRLEETVYHPSTYSGELYLELHRGTLTNQHQIKRNNRKAEIALHNLEYLTVVQAVQQHQAADGSAIAPLMGGLLVNQFHDILPGTCIPEAHDDALREVSSIIRQARSGSAAILEGMAEAGEKLTLVNPLSFDRCDPVYIPFDGHYVRDHAAQQVITDVEGEQKLVLAGCAVPGFGSLTLDRCDQLADSGRSVFAAGEGSLETPYYKVVFNEKGYLSSLTDKRFNRQLCGSGYALNTFLLAEDVPLAWDNWDIDADLQCKLRDSARLLRREVVADGCVEYRIRSVYQLTEKSTLTQDMIFYAHSPEIVFDTLMDWQDDHRLLKASFDTNIQTDFTSQEIQFGYLHRSTTRNTAVEKAKFEVPNHKYTDLSEPRYGAALLNDCKYGISVEGGSMRLTLHKGGCMPDYRGDKGLHRCTYALLPHGGSLSAEAVIRPAYRLNNPVLSVAGALAVEPLVRVDADNIIVETIKPAEEGGRQFVVRLYEAEGSRTVTNLTFSDAARQVQQTNMLEEDGRVLADTKQMEFGPFEIKTLLVSFE